MAYKKPPTVFLYKTVLSLYISIHTLECLTYKVGTLLETAIRPLKDKKFVHKRLFKPSQKFIYSIQISKKIKSYANWKTVFCYSIFRLYFHIQIFIYIKYKWYLNLFLHTYTQDLNANFYCRIKYNIMHYATAQNTLEFSFTDLDFHRIVKLT